MKIVLTDNFSHSEIMTAIGVLLMVAEIFVPGFILFPLGTAFLITALVGLFTSDWIILLSVLGVSELVLFFLFKNYVGNFYTKPAKYTNVEGMIGKECLVIEEISQNGSGYIKLYGDQWQAISEHGVAYPVNTRVVITGVDGNKVIVTGIN